MIIQLRTDYEAQERARLEKEWADLSWDEKAEYRHEFKHYFNKFAFEQE